MVINESVNIDEKDFFLYFKNILQYEDMYFWNEIGKVYIIIRASKKNRPNDLIVIYDLSIRH